jgi:Arc/MetJ family transcription regulator
VRRTIVVDDRLLDDAKQALGTRTIRETVERALREVTRKRRLDELWDSRGTWEIDMTLEELLRLREEP